MLTNRDIEPVRDASLIDQPVWPIWETPSRGEMSRAVSRPDKGSDNHFFSSPYLSTRTFPCALSWIHSSFCRDPSTPEYIYLGTHRWFWILIFCFVSCRALRSTIIQFACAYTSVPHLPNFSFCHAGLFHWSSCHLSLRFHRYPSSLLETN